MWNGFMKNKERIEQLELENFNLKNRMKALEQRLYMLECKKADWQYIYQDWQYAYPPQYIYPKVWNDDGVTAPTWDTQTVTNESEQRSAKTRI
jgi:hypothetical protein